MRKGKGFREPRRRGFDDDEPFSREGRGIRPARPFGDVARDAAPAEGPIVDATVKWFNPEKGFGFAEIADGSGDAFMHVAALQAAGFDSVQPGAKLRVHVGQGAKGPQITRVLEVDETNIAPPPPRRTERASPGGFSRRSVDVSNAVDMVGTVKWFNAEKGFGFVACDDGGKDVFLHISVLERSNIPHLAEGQRVAMGVVDTPKGREAVTVADAG
ncbi:MAG: cold shock domain-containing protein [Rhodospirillales bacterium]|nr:cold shock domain-containing protein [Rhodospirillales bacterium]